MRAAAALVAAVLLPALLAGCGFHLRQAPDLPVSMQRIYVAVPGGNGDLLRELRRGLESDDTEVLEDPTGATTILSIASVSRDSRPLSLNRRGVPLEYQVTTRVEFSMVVDGATVIEPQVVVMNRNYSYRVTNAISNEEQEAALRRSMAKDIAQFVIFRVVAAAKNLKGAYAAPAAVTTPAPATQAVPAAATALPPV